MPSGTAEHRRADLPEINRAPEAAVVTRNHIKADAARLKGARISESSMATICIATTGLNWKRHSARVAIELFIAAVLRGVGPFAGSPRIRRAKNHHAIDDPDRHDVPSNHRISAGSRTTPRSRHPVHQELHSSRRRKLVRNANGWHSPSMIPITKGAGRSQVRLRVTILIGVATLHVAERKTPAVAQDAIYRTGRSVSARPLVASGAISVACEMGLQAPVSGGMTLIATRRGRRQPLAGGGQLIPSMSVLPSAFSADQTALAPAGGVSVTRTVARTLKLTSTSNSQLT